MQASELNLVTGATGFVGRELCHRLRDQGRVRGLSRYTSDGPWDEYVGHDLTGDTPLEDALQGVGTVYHLAAKTDDSRLGAKESAVFYRVNFDGTAKLFEAAAAAGVERFVYLSSIKAMGSGGDERLDENSLPRPMTPYGRSKRAAEELVLESGGIPHVTVLRSTPVYGVGSKGNLARMAQAVSRGIFPPFPDIKNKRSMVHVEDLADALILSAQKREANGQVFIVTDGHDYTTRQIYEWVCEATGRKVPPWAFPLFVFRTLALVGDGVGRLTGKGFGINSLVLQRLFGSAFFDATRIRETLGFNPRRDLHSALPDMVSAILSAPDGH